MSPHVQVNDAPGWVTAHVGLGANLGDPVRSLRLALQALAHWPGVRLHKVSSFYRTAPVDSTGPDYVNAVAELRTQLPPHDLLNALQAIETAQGRERPYRNAPRTLDLDLLLHGCTRTDAPDLILPHPRMHQRAFVMVPLAEIAPQLVGTDNLAAVAGQAIERMPVADGVEPPETAA